MSDELLKQVREEVAAPDILETKEGKAPTRSALTRWLAQQQAAQRGTNTGPSYERCQERGCWGKASWTCPRCSSKACSAHRVEHACRLPYLPL